MQSTCLFLQTSACRPADHRRLPRSADCPCDRVGRRGAGSPTPMEVRMGMKTWVMVLMGAFAINLYLKSSRQKGLGDAGTGRALEGESTDDEMAGGMTPAATGTG